MSTQRELTHNGPRRAAMIWMLHQTGVSYCRLARMLKQNVSYVSNNGRKYDAIIERRQSEASDWREPWARRLKEAGAI